MLIFSTKFVANIGFEFDRAAHKVEHIERLYNNGNTIDFVNVAPAWWLLRECDGQLGNKLKIFSNIKYIYTLLGEHN